MQSTGQVVLTEMSCEHPGVDNTTDKCTSCGKPWKEVEAELMYKGSYNACEQCGALVPRGQDLCDKCKQFNTYMGYDSEPVTTGPKVVVEDILISREINPTCTCGPTETCPICKDTKLAAGIAPKHDAGKLQYSLIPTCATKALAEVLTFGAKKYAPNSWQGVENGERRYLDALYRHLEAYRSGEQSDPDSGLSHLSHAICNVAFLIHFEEQRNEATSHTEG